MQKKIAKVDGCGIKSHGALPQKMYSHDCRVYEPENYVMICFPHGVWNKCWKLVLLVITAIFILINKGMMVKKFKQPRQQLASIVMLKFLYLERIFLRSEVTQVQQSKFLMEKLGVMLGH